MARSFACMRKGSRFGDRQALRVSLTERQKAVRAPIDERLIEPFRIAVPDTDIADLRDRLARTRWPDAGAGAWSDGTDF